MTKIDIFSGFLGAGKTTLIGKLLKEALAGTKVVLIENEFGEIGIDGGFLQESGIEIKEMNSGCICCSLVGDFGTALQEVLEKYNPDRIIIEPSGVGKLSDVIKAVADVMESRDDVCMNGYVTVADATKCKMYMKNFGEFYNNQIESARTIVLSRTGKISDDKLQLALSLIREKNEKASIITTPWEEIDGKQILGAIEQSNTLEMELLEEEDVCPECGCHHDHHHDGHSCCGHHHDHGHHHADDIFTSLGMESAHKYSENELTEILQTLSAENSDFGDILRAKGIVPADEGQWFHFDLVPGEYEIRRGSADYTGRMCVIGAKLKEAKIKELFHI